MFEICVFGHIRPIPTIAGWIGGRTEGGEYSQEHAEVILGGLLPQGLSKAAVLYGVSVRLVVAVVYQEQKYSAPRGDFVMRARGQLSDLPVEVEVVVGLEVVVVVVVVLNVVDLVVEVEVVTARARGLVMIRS